MEDSFKVRVDKIFGSLASSTPPATATTISSSSLWSLTDDEIQKREWIRDKTIPEPEFESFFCNSHGKGFQKFNSPMELRDELERDLEDLDDDDAGDEPQRRPSNKPEDNDDEEWNIKSSIGQDCTLDYEEDRDEYDKLAIGGEKAEHRLYMRDVTDYAIDVDSCNELPDSFEEVARDPRANHLAAKLRLREDAEAAQKIDSLRVSEKDITGGEHLQINTSEGGVNLKSILKRKEAQLDSKSEKRVRFELEYEDDCNGGVCNEANFSTQCYSSAVPDYVRNPSKYTHYTFDSSADMDEASNKQAYMDFLKLIKRSNNFQSQPDAFIDLPAVTFIPKRKTDDTIMAKKPAAALRQNEKDAVGSKFLHRRELPTGIAAGDVEAGEVCAMEEDETEPVADGRNSSQRLGRNYRTKSVV
ncbi:hypothetical protein I3842_04G001600 [Carya illinoinensis]|uniref:U5 small nuclear ribonucleoprotein TSSC4 n=1 Tax=Carya illinoinensis TaxID=32201 RepID=A0A922F7Y9_CARIL|nr:hypothetical protein I3842_04G001600 [Carya illinoinensis]